MKRGDYSAATDCMQIAEKLESLPTIAPHWEEKETGQTEGEYFATLDMDGRRHELAQNWIVSGHRDSDGEISVTIGHKDFEL